MNMTGIRITDSLGVLDVPHLARISLQPLSDADSGRWDELIAPYPDRQVFHSQAWLDCLAASRGVTIRKWSIVDGSQVLGHFCAGQISKGPFRVLGSPLKGWGTKSMGPLLSEDTDLATFLTLLDDLAKSE